MDTQTLNSYLCLDILNKVDDIHTQYNLSLVCSLFRQILLPHISKHPKRLIMVYMTCQFCEKMVERVFTTFIDNENTYDTHKGWITCEDCVKYISISEYYITNNIANAINNNYDLPIYFLYLPFPIKNKYRQKKDRQLIIPRSDGSTSLGYCIFKNIYYPYNTSEWRILVSFIQDKTEYQKWSKIVDIVKANPSILNQKAFKEMSLNVGTAVCKVMISS